MRIGIGHPGPGRKDLVTPHVLGNYAKAEMETLSDWILGDLDDEDEDEDEEPVAVGAALEDDDEEVSGV